MGAARSPLDYTATLRNSPPRAFLPDNSYVREGRGGEEVVGALCNRSFLLHHRDVEGNSFRFRTTSCRCARLQRSRFVLGGNELRQKVGFLASRGGWRCENGEDVDLSQVRFLCKNLRASASTESRPPLFSTEGEGERGR